MEKLTEKDVFIGNYTNENITIVGQNDDSVLTAYIGKPIDKLAEYEKTNKMPEQVEKLIEKNKTSAKENRKLKKEMLRMLNHAWYNQEDENEQE